MDFLTRLLSESVKFQIEYLIFEYFLVTKEEDIERHRIFPRGLDRPTSSSLVQIRR